MNTYDPADGIVYLHLAPDPYSYGIPVVSGSRRDRLAAGLDQVAPYPPGGAVTTHHHLAPPAGGRSTHGDP